MKEIWKPIVGFERLYEISSKGRIKSLPRSWTGRTHIFTTEEKIIKSFINTWGYRFIALSKNSIKSYKTIHRLIAESFIPNPDNKPQINHINGIKLDNRISNLEWVTRSENMTHAVNMGLVKCGEKSITAILAQKDVEFILKNRGKIKGVTLARKFGVSKSTISKIYSGKNWNKAIKALKEKLNG